MPILYILCGIPGCGKSTFAKNFLEKYETAYVSRDEVRLGMVNDTEEYFSKEKEVFKNFVSNITNYLSDGINVIADATHLNMASRRKLTYAIDQTITNYKIVYVIFDTSLETCLNRNAKRTGRQNVPEDVVKSMYNNFRIPRNDEDKRMIGMITVKGDIV